MSDSEDFEFVDLEEDLPKDSPLRALVCQPRFLIEVLPNFLHELVTCSTKVPTPLPCIYVYHSLCLSKSCMLYTLSSSHERYVSCDLIGCQDRKAIASATKVAGSMVAKYREAKEERRKIEEEAAENVRRVHHYRIIFNYICISRLLLFISRFL